MYTTFGQKPAYTEKTVVKSKPRVKLIKGSVMDEHTIKCNTETRRNKEQVNNIKPIVPANPQIKTRDIPSRVANSVTERNSYGLGYHNK